MLNEERTKLMTKISILEEKTGKESLTIGNYYKSDYISFQMVRTFLATTVAFVLMLVLGVMYQVDFLMGNLHKVQLTLLAKEILVGFICYSIVMQVIAYGVYATRYYFAQKHLKVLKENVEELSDIYNKSERNRS